MQPKTPMSQSILLWPEGTLGPGQMTPGDTPQLTPYLVETQSAAPVIVVCPGGGYGGRAPHEGEPVAQWLNTLGISAVVLSYRVAPHRHPAPLQDAQRAIRTVREQARIWNIDPRKVGILGFSAGGHLAATAATHYDTGKRGAADPVERHSCRPDAVVLCYAVISFGVHRHQGSMNNLLGDTVDEEVRRLLSNETQVNAQTPPTFLWHTADDAAVPVANSLLFATALGNHGVPFALHVFPHGRHGLGLAQDDPQVGVWTTLCGSWLAGMSWGSAPRPVTR